MVDADVVATVEEEIMVVVVVDGQITKVDGRLGNRCGRLGNWGGRLSNRCGCGRTEQPW